MLFVRGLALLLLLSIAALLVDALVPDRDVAARIETRIILIGATSQQAASMLTPYCGEAIEADCARMAALPQPSP